MHPCILIKDADHVCICGKGRINGSGRPWWERAWYHRDRFHGPEIDIEKELAALNGSYSDQPSGGGGRESQFLRPPLLQMLRSSDASISGVTFVDSPFWTIHSVFSKGIAIRDVRIANPSVGLFLCTGKDDTVVEYSLSRSLSPAMVADYTLHLPDKKKLKEKMREIAELSAEKLEENESN